MIFLRAEEAALYAVFAAEDIPLAIELTMEDPARLAAETVEESDLATGLQTTSSHFGSFERAPFNDGLFIGK